MTRHEDKPPSKI